VNPSSAAAVEVPALDDTEITLEPWRWPFVLAPVPLRYGAFFRYKNLPLLN
jgi:hypothetical protein